MSTPDSNHASLSPSNPDTCWAQGAFEAATKEVAAAIDADLGSVRQEWLAACLRAAENIENETDIRPTWRQIPNEIFFNELRKGISNGQIRPALLHQLGQSQHQLSI